MTEEKKQKNRKRSIPFFWIIYVLCSALLAGFWVWVVRYVQNGLEEYENAQPYHLAETLTRRIQSGDTGVFSRVDWEATRFEEPDAAQQDFWKGIQGKTITCRKDAVSYDAANITYRFYADDVPIGTTTLREVSSQPLLFILSVGQWESDPVLPVYKAEEKSVSVTVPDTFQVRINGIAADERERKGERKELEQFRYAKNYVEVPGIVEYHVEGLLEMPVVEIRDGEGRKVEGSRQEKDGNAVITADAFAVSEMEEALAEEVLQNAEAYSNFFSTDLPGSKASVAPLRGMFPEDSYYLELAETYRREDMWMFNEHAEPTFERERVDNYIRYSDELFSCEVYFEKNMVLTNTGQKRVDVTHSRFFYGKIDGVWKILDIQTILDAVPGPDA